MENETKTFRIKDTQPAYVTWTYLVQAADADQACEIFLSSAEMTPCGPPEIGDNLDFIPEAAPIIEEYVETTTDPEDTSTAAGSISATVHSDDYFIDFEFNAAPWFSQASDDEIVALAKIDWGGDYEADAVAQFFAESTTKKLFDYLATGSSVGFECHINSAEAMRWLRENRPEVAKAIDLLP